MSWFPNYFFKALDSSINDSRPITKFNDSYFKITWNIYTSTPHKLWLLFLQKKSKTPLSKFIIFLILIDLASDYYQPKLPSPRFVTVRKSATTCRSEFSINTDENDKRSWPTGSGWRSVSVRPVTRNSSPLRAWYHSSCLGDGGHQQRAKIHRPITQLAINLFSLRIYHSF